jgi:integrase
VKEEQAKEDITFELVAREWHATNKKWSEEHSRRMLKSLEDNLFPAIGKRSIDSFSTCDLLFPIKVVEATGRLEVASRLQ